MHPPYQTATAYVQITMIDIMGSELISNVLLPLFMGKIM